MLHGLDLPAIAADAARDTRLDRLFAVESLGKPQSERPAAHAWRPREKIGMTGGIKHDMLPQHIYSPFMSEQMPVARFERPVHVFRNSSSKVGHQELFFKRQS